MALSNYTIDDLEDLRLQFSRLANAMDEMKGRLAKAKMTEAKITITEIANAASEASSRLKRAKDDLTERIKEHEFKVAAERGEADGAAAAESKRKAKKGK